MNALERFCRVCDFQPVDMPPKWDTLGFWRATVERWHSEGLPADISPEQFFGMDRRDFLPVNSGLTGSGFCPPFEREVIAEDERTITYRDTEGIIKRERKDRPELSMPQFLEFPVSNRRDWENVEWRLDPASPERYPDWDEISRIYGNRDFPLGFTICGAYGLPRNLFGEERLAYMYYDDPVLMHDIAEHWVFFYKGLFDRTFPNFQVDYIYFWEDMAFKNGPLIGPNLVREFMLPYYKEVIAAAKSYGIKYFLLDSDGDNRPILDCFIEAGVNVFLPLEIAAGMDPLEIRATYGRNLALWGGIDKRVLAQDKEAIKRELMRVIPPLIEEGGFIPAVDHGVPPDVSFSNYCYFIELMRELSYHPM